LEQQSGLSREQKSLLVALFGGVIVAGIWFAVSMSIVTTIIFGLPIGAVGALVVYRTVSRMSRKSPPSPDGQSSSNGTQPAQKKREEASPASAVKLK
jgi:membrane protein implicated in regulation of membrane protease activity